MISESQFFAIFRITIIVQSHNQGESKLNSTINVSSSPHTLTQTK